MSVLEQRIESLTEAARRWLSDDNEHMLRAVHDTTEEGYFSFGDVQFALKALKEALTRDSLEQWAERGGITEGNDASDKNILCLHAGNLPLVGFQDALAVLLSGARYTGKISRKDPYLLPTFLNEVKKTETWSGVDVQWTHRLDDFEGMQTDAVLFAGSERSVPDVKEAVDRHNVTGPDAEYLIRTAHFSMAWFDPDGDADWENLTDGILRYGGKGCRSVAVVVAPFGLEEAMEKLRPHMETFLEANPQHVTPGSRLKHQSAYNSAVQNPQIVFDEFLVQESNSAPAHDFMCSWMEGDKSQVADLADRFGDQLQSIYTVAENEGIPGLEEQTELLASAQRPPVWWQPDRTDVLQWLCRGTDV